MKGKLIALHRTAGVVEEMSDEALVAACAVGETAALGALFDRYHADVFRFLGWLAGDDASLDDLVQAAFLEVQAGASRFSGRSGVKTWIFAIAANVFKNHVRGETRRRSMAARYAEMPRGPAASPEHAAERGELLGRLAAALAALPHDLRVAFVLCELEEVPGVEAARVVGVREGTLWRRLHDARKRLRAAIEGGSP